MFKIAICDDEHLCIEVAKNSIKKWAEENDVTIEVYSFDNGDAFLDGHKQEDFDLVFLDIMMPLLNGMDLAHEIRKTDAAVKIVFLTSSPEFAVESYDVKASGYLLKPLAYDRFSKVLNDCVALEDNEPDNIVLKTISGYDKIYHHNIDHIEAQNKKVLFKCIDGEVIEALNTFSYFADQLANESGFFKCHRSYIAYIPNINHFDQHEIITKSGTHIPISRNLSKPFKDAYFAYMFRKECD